MITKICTKCLQPKGELEFYKDKKNSDGLTYHCKICTKSRTLANYKASRQEGYISFEQRQSHVQGTTKICTKCKERKEFSEFYEDKRRKTGTQAECKKCFLLAVEEYRKTDKGRLVRKKEQINRRGNERDKIRKKKWRESEVGKQYMKDYLERPGIKERIKASRKTPENKAKVNEYLRLRRKKDPIFALLNDIRTRTRQAFNLLGYEKENDTIALLGCSPLELYYHITNQFLDGMTWKDRKTFDIDHIIPLSLAKSKEELIKLAHYTNLQPLPPSINRSKGNKLLK